MVYSKYPKLGYLADLAAREYRQEMGITMLEKKVRQSNFELLRVISVILILMSHCDDFFGFGDAYSTTLGVNKLINDWLHAGGQIGVGCFVLISGYFMVQQDFSLKRILKLAGEIWFYAIGIWAVWLALNIYQGEVQLGTTLVQTVYAFFPLLFTHYWFATAYTILMILSPFFNKLIFSMDRKNYRTFLTILIVIFVVLQGGIPKALQEMSEGRLIPVFIMYFIAGYLKRFRTERKYNAARHFSVAAGVYILLIASSYIITLLGVMLDSQSIVSQQYFYRVLNSPFIVVICTELFIGMMETPIKYNKRINEVAACSFGIYLIHTNRLMWGYLTALFPIYKETRPLFVLLYTVISIAVIYLVCLLVELIRRKTVEKLWMAFLDKYLDKIQKGTVLAAKKAWRLVQKGLDAFYGANKDRLSISEKTGSPE